MSKRSTPPRVISFFFSCSAVRRDLHSFPTRRSSDLVIRHHYPGLSYASWYHELCRRTRSEEHTSELQSPYDLVCRLLLEKKKQRIVEELLGHGELSGLAVQLHRERIDFLDSVGVADP